MENFFTNAFNNMDAEAKESFYKTIFMNDDSEYAAKLRLEYYRTKFRSMGENVTIGKGVDSVSDLVCNVGGADYLAALNGFNDFVVVSASAVTGKLNVVVDKLTVEEYGHCCKLCNASVLVQLCRAYEYVVCLPLTGSLTHILYGIYKLVNTSAFTAVGMSVHRGVKYLYLITALHVNSAVSSFLS